MLPNDPTRRWEKCKETLSKLLNREIIEQRIEPLRIQELSETAVVLEVPHNLAIDALRRGFAGLIQHAVEDTLGWHPTITFVPEAQVHAPHRRAPAWTSLPPVEMHPSYTFETFVVGSNSQFAHSAARAVADAPGRTRFNPLLIYGGVGLGKTHLLQAIGHRGLSLQPDLRVRFVPAETFLREFLDSLSNNKIDLFKNFYRNEVDLLLMDDIQFLSGRDAVQEEFFHLFNALHQSNRQIVLTSDCPPGELQGLEDRLVSRFQWGLFVDIQPPDRDTREAILRSKAAAENLDLSDEIIAFLAENINSNIRVLEGAIRHLILRANLRKSDITIDLAQEIVDATAQPSSARRVSPDEIMSVVAEHFQVDGESLRREGRGTKEVAKARQVSMYLIKQLIDLSLKSIGNHFGNRDHSTVIHAIRTTEKAMHESSGFKAEIESLLKKFR